MFANFVDDDGEPQSDSQEWAPEDPCRLDDARAADGDRIFRAQIAKHDDRVLAYGDVLAEMDATEEIDEVMANGAVVVSGDAAEEVDDIVIGVAGDVDVAKESHYIAIDGAFDVDAAEKADGIVDGLLGTDLDGTAELDDVFGGASGGCYRETGKENQSGG